MKVEDITEQTPRFKSLVFFCEKVGNTLVPIPFAELAEKYE